MSRKRLLASSVDESFAITKRSTFFGRHHWTIENFLHRVVRAKKGDFVKSKFTVQVEEGRELFFVLQVFPNGNERIDHNNFVSVFLHHLGPEEVDLTCEFSLEQTNNTHKVSLDCLGQFDRKNVWGTWTWLSHAVLKDRALDLLPDGDFTLVCDIEIRRNDVTMGGKRLKLTDSLPSLGDDTSPNPGYFTSSNQSDSSPNLDDLTSLITDDNSPSLTDDISSLLDNSTFSDISLVCQDNRLFSCHKVILAARSSTFTAMLSSTLNADNILINDVESEVMEQLLKYIYTDDCDINESNAVKLLAAADKYNLRGLKSKCEEIVGRNVSVGNFGEAGLPVYNISNRNASKKIPILKL